MIRRLAAIATVLGACIAAVVLTGASSEPQGKTFKAEFDNAFGLTEGGDLRIGGVTAGQTTGFEVSSGEPAKAVVEFKISEPGFDSLRTDARCDVRQQSLIGEYYVDCQPGSAEEELPAGATIPVEQTASIIATDLVNNVLRRPYRERLRLIIAELGAGLAGRPQDLAETIRRAHPGLRETTKTLGILKDQTGVIQDFVTDSDTVVKELADRKADVARFVKEAGETAEISATRKEELAEQFEKFPTFLRELEPTMVRLGQLSDEQIPLLSDLRLASSDLNRFFTELGPFAQATRPALRSLGDTSIVGRRALVESASEIRQLRRVARGAGRLGEPLRQFLQTLDDRERAIETDDRALSDPPSFDPESLDNPANRNLNARGFTAMEGFLNYIFWQTLGINSFDGPGHFLRILGVLSEGDGGCTPYRAQPTRLQVRRCNSFLGPKQPGIEEATGRIRGKNFRGYDVDLTEGGGSGGSSASSASSGDSRKQSDDDKKAVRNAIKDSENAVKTPVPSDVESMLQGGSSAPRTTRATQAPPRPASRHRTSSSTSSSAHEQARSSLHRREPGAGRCRDGAHHRGVGLPRLQRQPGPAVRPDLRGEGGAPERRQPRQGQRGEGGRLPRRGRRRDRPADGHRRRGPADDRRRRPEARQAGRATDDRHPGARAPALGARAQVRPADPGAAETTFQPGDTIPLANAGEPVEFDDFLNTFDDELARRLARRARGLRRRARRARPVAQHRARRAAGLPRLFDRRDGHAERRADPARSVLPPDRPRLAQVAPVARVQAELFTNMAETFEAFSRDPAALQATIEGAPPTLDEGIESFRVQRPSWPTSPSYRGACAPPPRSCRALPAINSALPRRPGRLAAHGLVPAPARRCLRRARRARERPQHAPRARGPDDDDRRRRRC